jgi:drug/metabolite transporter (DMT)-like permease
VKPQTVFLLVVVNGFVGFYCWHVYQHGMPASHALLVFLAFLFAVNAAVALGRNLGLRRRSHLRQRK